MASLNYILKTLKQYVNVNQDNRLQWLVLYPELNRKVKNREYFSCFRNKDFTFLGVLVFKKTTAEHKNKCNLVDKNTSPLEIQFSKGSKDYVVKEPNFFLKIGVYVCLVAQLRLTLQPHGPQPARLLCPLDSPGKNTGVGCCVLLHTLPWML